jgi:hypothetical protein
MPFVRPPYRLALASVALCAIVSPGAAFAAGGYIAKPPTPYRGSCELTKPEIVSIRVGDRCVAVDNHKPADAKAPKSSAQ